jgi:hypothetical protein
VVGDAELVGLPNGWDVVGGKARLARMTCLRARGQETQRRAGVRAVGDGYGKAAAESMIEARKINRQRCSRGRLCRAEAKPLTTLAAVTKQARQTAAGEWVRRMAGSRRSRERPSCSGLACPQVSEQAALSKLFLTTRDNIYRPLVRRIGACLATASEHQHRQHAPFAVVQRTPTDRCQQAST